MKYTSAWRESLCGESQDLGEAGIQRYALSVSNLDSYSRLMTDYTVKNSKSHTESMAEHHFELFVGRFVFFGYRQLAVGRWPRFSNCSTFVENRGYFPSAISLFHSKTHTDVPTYYFDFGRRCLTYANCECS